MQRSSAPKPTASAHRGRAITVVAVAGLLVSLGCQRGAPSSPPEPEPEPPQLPSLFEPGHVEPLDLSPDPLPDGVAAAVDGEPISEVEVERILQTLASAVDSEPVDHEALHRAAVQQAVEHHLLLAKADQLDVRVTEEDLQRTIDDLATQHSLTVEQLREQLAEQGWTWEQYREQLVGQITETKVLHVVGVLGGQRDAAAIEARRARVVGCMRARAEVQVRDEALALPENPFDVVADIGEFRFVGAPELPEDTLRAAARAAAARRVLLCDALTSAELAVEETYLDHGYLEAQVNIPWPNDVTAPVRTEVEVAPGQIHVVGAFSFDQSAVPEPRRLDEHELRTQLATITAPGDLATRSIFLKVNEQMTRAFRRAGLTNAEPVVEFEQGKARVRVNIQYRVTDPTRLQ